jgi:cell division protease FtsH
LKVHSKNKQLEPTISLDWIAEMTSGFSGAQLKNLLNEAAIYAARDSRTVLTEQDLLCAIDKLVVGLFRKSETRSPDALQRVAIHEMGHAFLCHMFPEYFDLKKVSIQSTYNGAGGYTLFQEHANITESGLYTKDLMKKRLTIALGGKAAEFIYYGENHISLGAIQDLKQANSLAQRMIGQYGMGERLKVFYNENMDGGRSPFPYSDKTREVFDHESLQLVQEAYQDAVHILLENRGKMDEMIQILLLKSILYGHEIPI